ncbi:MAG TPA: hypothetical protein VJC16_01865 [Candidatus Nanoarchaeia archaeon]|nr:hypothetical protein [Candidatus Nanoarchaeia archaeon]
MDMKMNINTRRIGALLGFAGVIFGLIAIFRLIVDTEVAIGFVTISFGVLAIIWTTMALHSLSPGSALRRHTFNFLLCLAFILMFSIWHTLEKIFSWRTSINEALLYPGYLLIALAFLLFVGTAWQILTLGREFGFQGQASAISKIIKEKQRQRQSGRRGGK